MDNLPEPPTTSERRRVLIVDDHPLVRRGLESLLADRADLEVCGAVGTIRDALRAVAASRPDLVIVDLALGEEDGLSLVEELRATSPAPRMLVLSLRDAPRWARRALRAGADGCASKRETGETLVGAMRAVLRGERYVSPHLAPPRDGAPPPPSPGGIPHPEIRGVAPMHDRRHRR